jgi:hypothetical protein
MKKVKLKDGREAVLITKVQDWHIAIVKDNDGFFGYRSIRVIREMIQE